MKNYQKIDKLANKIASYLLYWGFDIDYLEKEVELSSFLTDLYDELETEDQVEIDTIYNCLVELVSEYLGISVPESYHDTSIYEYEILAPQIENFINDRVRENAKRIMASSEFEEYIDEITTAEDEANIIEEVIGDTKGDTYMGLQTVYYAGTLRDYNENKDKRGIYGGGVHFIFDREKAKEIKRRPLVFSINIKNPYISKEISPFGVLSELRNKFPELTESNISEVLQQHGYDAIIYDDWDEGKVVSMLDHKKAKLISDNKLGEDIKNTRVLLGKHKLNEDIPSSVSPEVIEKTANFLKYQYNLDDYNDSYYAAVEFFSSDDWYELRKAIRYGIEELDEAFEQLSDYNNREAREYRLKTSKLINIWNQFAAIAKEEFRNAESDDDRYTLFKAIDTDGWAISNIPHSIISKIITG